jgi:lysophospholipase L1-like esterase
MLFSLIWQYENAAAGFYLPLHYCLPKEQVVTRPIAPANTTTTPRDTSAGNQSADTSAKAYYYLALGDSYTIGQSVPATERFPVQLTALLQQDKINFAEPEIIAQTGWTTQSLLNRLSSAAPAKRVYDIVTLLIGVNNQFQNRPAQEYSQQFTKLLQMSIEYAANNRRRVIVLSIPDYSVTPFAASYNPAKIAEEIDAFNLINKTISESFGVQYLYITDATRKAATDLSLLATDKLHPSGKAYAQWATMLLPMVKQAIQ